MIHNLTVYETEFEKKRIGKINDGGYVILMLPDISYDVLLSCGISDDISFEDDFLKTVQDIECFAYDGTILSLPKSDKCIVFIKKNIGTIDSPNTTNLHTMIDAFSSIFLKMDIEGYEIPWINTLSIEQLNKFKQIVIEFHFPFTYEGQQSIEKLAQTHMIVHFHANNCCGVREYNGVIIPNVFECTYVRKDIIGDKYKLNTQKIPSIYDMKNVMRNDEIYIDYPPFVYLL